MATLTETIEALGTGHVCSLREAVEHGQMSRRRHYRYECECKVSGEWRRGPKEAHEDWCRHVLGRADEEQLAVLQRAAEEDANHA